MDQPKPSPLDQVLARPIVDPTPAVWGFMNRTDFVTLADGDRVVVQRYRRREDAERRLRVMRALREPAALAGIPIPRIREFDLEADPAWVMFDVLPGVPIPEADEVGPEGRRFPMIARPMGRLLAAFRALPTAGLELDDLWADPGPLAPQARGWAHEVLSADAERATLVGLLDRFPALFAGRPVVLAHGDFAPVNMLTDGASLTGLLDFESVRLADPLFDVAWWAWAVSFASPLALERAWRPFLEGLGADPAEPELHERLHALQVLRLLEILASEKGINPQVRQIVEDRLRSTLR